MGLEIACGGLSWLGLLGEIAVGGEGSKGQQGEQEFLDSLTVTGSRTGQRGRGRRRGRGTRAVGRYDVTEKYRATVTERQYRRGKRTGTEGFVEDNQMQRPNANGMGTFVLMSEQEVSNQLAVAARIDRGTRGGIFGGAEKAPGFLGGRHPANHHRLHILYEVKLLPIDVA